MATRTLIIDLTQGSGNEPMYGVVTVQRIHSTTQGNFEVLPWETTLKLVDGKATIEDAVTDGTGPIYNTAYLIRVMNGYCAPRWGFMAALPDGDTPISTGEMPKVNPLTGEGVYMDAQEWNALYGQLPDRVSALETSQTAQDTLIAGKANKVHSHVVGDVTGLQTALNGKGNATLRVDNTVGKRVFISDGTAEHLVSGDTGWRNINSALEPMWEPSLGGLVISRSGDAVYVQAYLKATSAASGVSRSGATRVFAAMPGFRPSQYAGRGTAILKSNIPGVVTSLATPTSIEVAGFATGGSYVAGDTVTFSVSYQTTDPWPTTLPGTPA